jgi:arsenate reductase-like glutaredoxin family protein
MDKKDIRVYGAERCHKTQFYLQYFRDKQLAADFLDVERDETAARELRGLYTTGKLNFPTILIKDKKLRNPRIEEIEQWLVKKEIIDETEA